MYETETAAQQPINQLQNNGGHSGAKALLADDGCCVVGEHNNHLIVAECTNLASLVLTNGQEAAVMNAPLGEGGAATAAAAPFKYAFREKVRD